MAESLYDRLLAERTRERNHQRLIRLGLHLDDCAYCRCACGRTIPGSVLIAAALGVELDPETP